MAEHSVTLEIANEIEVGNVDLKIRIRRDGDRFGTLTLSRGSIDWKPRKAKRGKQSETRLSWTDFDAVMKDANQHRRS
jgi:hypothetical protein